jgi:membrane protein
MNTPADAIRKPTEKIAVKLRNVWTVLKEALYQWYFEHDTFLNAAAISYCAIFAIAPLFVIAVEIAGLVYGPGAAEGELAQQMDQVTGPTIANAIQDVVKNAYASGAGRTATLISVALLWFGARSFFVQLQQTLNRIWGVKTPTTGWGILAFLKSRLLAYLMVLVVGLLLLAAVAANAALNVVERWVPVADLPGGGLVWNGLHWVFSLSLLTLLFALMFKILPEASIPWRVVWAGAFVTAILFAIGNAAIGLYLAYSTTASAFGAAGSLVVVLAWVYYSSQVVLFGAELTEASARFLGLKPPCEPLPSPQPEGLRESA